MGEFSQWRWPLWPRCCHRGDCIESSGGRCRTVVVSRPEAASGVRTWPGHGRRHSGDLGTPPTTTSVCSVGSWLTAVAAAVPVLSFQRARPRLLCTNVQNGSAWGTTTASTAEAASGQRKLASGQWHWWLPHWPLGEVPGLAASCQRSESRNLNSIYPSLNNNVSHFLINYNNHVAVVHTGSDRIGALT